MPIYLPSSSPRQVMNATCPSQGLYLVPYRHPVWPAVICVFTLPCLSHTHHLAEKTNHPHHLSSERLQEMMHKQDSFLAPWSCKSSGSEKRAKAEISQEKKEKHDGGNLSPSSLHLNVLFWELTSLHLIRTYRCLHNVHLSPLISFNCAGGVS